MFEYAILVKQGKRFTVTLTLETVMPERLWTCGIVKVPVCGGTDIILK